MVKHFLWVSFLSGLFVIQAFTPVRADNIGYPSDSPQFRRQGALGGLARQRFGQARGASVPLTEPAPIPSKFSTPSYFDSNSSFSQSIVPNSASRSPQSSGFADLNTPKQNALGQKIQSKLGRGLSKAEQDSVGRASAEYAQEMRQAEEKFRRDYATTLGVSPDKVNGLVPRGQGPAAKVGVSAYSATPLIEGKMGKKFSVQQTDQIKRLEAERKSQEMAARQKYTQSVGASTGLRAEDVSDLMPGAFKR